MMDDYGFHYGDETSQNNPKWEKTEYSKDSDKKHHILGEVITVLRALVNIFDIISSNFNRKP